ncbi:dipeptidase PepV [Evansella clarkii]|uniref:dipeptidase PepV n=1 Tax=Evansella clarkii TaxID=79879 RepID=UPI000B44D3D1|nr:dipeptidase PepV [Evansella clarkii]
MADWQAEVEKRETEFISDTQDFLKIKSVLDESTAQAGSPFGRGIRECYDWLLNKADKDGFTVKDLEGYAGHIEFGDGEEIVGVICHIDVVPEGEGWTSPPFAAEIRDGRIYARGAIDDKGPTMAAYYALKIVKEMNLPLQKRVRIIIGTDEESQWRCVSHYFKHERMPETGFAPDAVFPIIYAEKGICDLSYTKDLTNGEKGAVLEFRAGERFNMVPEQAFAVLQGVIQEEVEKSFNFYLEKNHLQGSVSGNGSEIRLNLTGKSAHGLEPEKGLNSGLLLAAYITDHIKLNAEEETYFPMLKNFFLEDSRGEKLGIAHTDEEKGHVTQNLGILRYKAEGKAEIGINLRYPEGADFSAIQHKLNDFFTESSYQAVIKAHEKPHAVEKSHPLIKTLAKVYEEQTGDEAECIAIGGGTYARSLKAGAAFGPLFPGEEDAAHQADEYISVASLKKAAALYAQAIYELAR